MTNFNEYLKYNSETGEIIWIKPTSKKIKIGQIAGSKDAYGYLVIHVQGKDYKAHRLAWYLHYGKWPINQIDHINGIKNDNKINNLRDVTNQQNHYNKKGHRENTYKYYSFHKGNKKWQVRASINGKQKHFGYFETEEKALQFIQNNVELFKGVV
jgi:hypothetical protein